MARPNYLRQIRERIDAAAPGSVFIPSDFADIAEAVNVNMCLNRLKESGGLTSIRRGVYMKPRRGGPDGRTAPPRSDDLAGAIARNFGWTIVPCGDTALNALGLSARTPSVWMYVSDGPYKSYEVDGVRLRFKHTDKKSELIGVSYETALVIQALKALGEENITARTLQLLSDRLDEGAKARLLAEGQHATAWVYTCIRRICAGEAP